MSTWAPGREAGTRDDGEWRLPPLCRRDSSPLAGRWEDGAVPLPAPRGGAGDLCCRQLPGGQGGPSLPPVLRSLPPAPGLLPPEGPVRGVLSSLAAHPLRWLMGAVAEPHVTCRELEGRVDHVPSQATPWDNRLGQFRPDLGGGRATAPLRSLWPPQCTLGGQSCGPLSEPSARLLFGASQAPVEVPGQEGSLCPFTNCCRAAQEVATAS